MKNRFNWSEVLSDEKQKTDYQKFVAAREAVVNSFLEFSPAKGLALKQESQSPLAGMPFAVKDSIAVSGFQLTCASRVLENFIAPYTATAVQKLLDCGAVPVGKTNMDEFAMGSSCDNSALAVTNNPYDPERVAGGSSGGSAAAVAAGLVGFALGTDTGGSVRQPANFCGLYGLKPTYGHVSRFGLVAYASSLEVVGIFSRCLDILGQVFDAVKGPDKMDQTTKKTPETAPAPQIKKVAVLGGDLGLSDQVAQAYAEARSALRELGWTEKEISIPNLDYGVSAYYTIATAEASANLARYDGVKYGLRAAGKDFEDMVRQTRRQGFGDEVKLRILLGAYVLRSGFQDRYYLLAQKIRAALSAQFKQIFEQADALMLPVYPVQAFRRGSAALSPFKQKQADLYTTVANLAGLPALAVPTGLKAGLPVGVQFMGPAFAEDRLLAAARQFAPLLPIPDEPCLEKQSEF